MEALPIGNGKLGAMVFGEVAREPCDMRKSFNGLDTAVHEKLSADPLSGALFLFSNKKRNRMKILYWDGSSLWILAMLADGIYLKDGMTRSWYEENRIN